MLIVISLLMGFIGSLLSPTPVCSLQKEATQRYLFLQQGPISDHVDIVIQYSFSYFLSANILPRQNLIKRQFMVISHAALFHL